MKILIVLILLPIFIWILWLVSSRKRRRQFVLPLAGVILAILVIISPLGVGLGLWGLISLVPPDSGERADSIVVLGRGGGGWRDSRINTVKELWKSNRAPQIFVSGNSDAQKIVQILEEFGIPSNKLSGEECSQTTEENAVFTSAFLNPKGIKKSILVTDPAHMLRSILMFQTFGFHIIPYFSPLPFPYQIKHILREYAGLVTYFLSGNFSPLSANSINNPPVNVTQRISEWRCQVKS